MITNLFAGKLTLGASFFLLLAGTCPADPGAPPAASPSAGICSLEQFGDIRSPADAEGAFRTAVERLRTSGGGVLLIPPGAPPELTLDAVTQSAPGQPGVTILDYRDGLLNLHLPPFGKKWDQQWPGLQITRTLNSTEGNASKWHPMIKMNNNVITGGSSYMACLTEAVGKGKDQRCYVDQIRGIRVGGELRLTGTPFGYGKPHDDILVKAIGWDREKRRNYFVADLEHDHPAVAMVYNKSQNNPLILQTHSNSDNQTAGQLCLNHYIYGVGDQFSLSGRYHYMGDIMSGFGDEGGIIFNAETMMELDGFHATVEATDWHQDTIVYTPGNVNAHTLAVSRPLINMNKTKWLTAGTVRIVGASMSYKETIYGPTVGSGNRRFHAQGGGLILGSADSPWTEEIVGRFFAVTDPTEVLLPEDEAKGGGMSKLPGRPVYRWYQIANFTRNADGTKTIRILRVRWSATDHGAPNLYRDDNYTCDGHERPLSYAIAPGAWIYDISQGWKEASSSLGLAGKSDPRRLKLVPNGDRNTAFDFQPGDAVEQPPGADPWCPRPIRIRQFDQMPSTIGHATIEVKQMGRVQVENCLRLMGMIRSRDKLEQRKDQKPPFDTMIEFDSLARVGLHFGGECLEAAIHFEQPNGYRQPLVWSSSGNRTSTLAVDPATGSFEFTGGTIAIGHESLTSVRGIAGGNQPAHNLRGIDVPVPHHANESTVVFDTPESNRKYAVIISPSWLTAYAVSHKGDGGFTVSFAVPAPDTATFDWVIIR